jgi:tRNA threonylcarbamoyl adenosine modification protein YeaZ
MITLAMDTAYKQLVVGLYKDHTLLKGVSLEAFKKQSETVFVELNALLKECGLTYKDINEIVITDGPGSYTGIRIAMTIAKVLCTQLPIDLYVISTMQLYAGKQKDVNVILDARSKRAYCGHVHEGKMEEEECILSLDQIPAWLQENKGVLAGDAYLVEQEGISSNYLQNFMDVREYWRKVDNVHALTPRYLKESDAYKV